MSKPFLSQAVTVQEADKGFDAGFGLGGGSSFGGQGTRGVPFQKQAEADTSATGGAKTTVYYNSISAMPAYNSKSHEELRWEDYQVAPPPCHPFK